MEKNSIEIENVREEISQYLKQQLIKGLPFHQSSEVYQYALLPPGKLIRPLLVKALYCDLKGVPLDTKSSPDSPETLLSLAIEAHHAYSLIHDDMPCMDNDDYRRGKLTTHKAFGEWQALLTGDGLLNLSYYFLSKIPDNAQVFSFFSWALGPKGLILGQWLDLETQNTPPKMSTQVEIMNLKTARLMQCSLVCSYLLIAKTPLEKEIKDPFFTFFRLGKNIGIMFQLLDDLIDLSHQQENLHEFEINPFTNSPDESMNILLKSIRSILSVVDNNSLENIKSVLIDLFKKTINYLHGNQEFYTKAKIPNFNYLIKSISKLNDRNN